MLLSLLGESLPTSGVSGVPGAAPTCVDGSIKHVLRKFLVLFSLTALIFASGCGLRIDTDPPSEPEPDAQELALEQAISNVRAVRTQSQRFLDEVKSGAEVLPQDADEVAVETLLGEIAAQTDLHLSLLGASEAEESGVAADADDDSSVASPDSDESEDSAESAEPAEQSITLRKLRGTIGANTLDLIDLTTQTDPEIARLLGSIAVAMHSWDAGLASATASESAEDAAEAEPSAQELALRELPSLTELDSPSAAWIPLVGAWDRIGYLLEIAAARSPENRSSLQDAAREYRQRAQDWALTLGVAGGDDDPRLVSYESPELTGDFEQDVAALQAEVRASVGEVNFLLGDLLYTLEANQRPAAVIELMQIQADNERWGVPAANLPGLREHAVTA